MGRPRVYVAGPIAGQTFDGSTVWRSFVESQLPEAEILTPLRGKDFLAQLPSMPLTSAELMTDHGDGSIAMSNLEAAISREMGIWRRDTWDVSRCDLVLANFLPGDEIGKVSIGTACEVYLAGFLHTPVVSVLTKRGIHDHPFITGSSWVVVRTMAEAFHATRIALNLPQPGREAGGY